MRAQKVPTSGMKREHGEHIPHMFYAVAAPATVIVLMLSPATGSRREGFNIAKQEPGDLPSATAS